MQIVLIKVDANIDVLDNRGKKPFLYKKSSLKQEKKFEIFD